MDLSGLSFPQGHLRGISNLGLAAMKIDLICMLAFRPYGLFSANLVDPVVLGAAKMTG
jgi:hypothetical protein